MDLTTARFCDVVSCGARLRRASEGAESLEEAAQSLSEYLYESLRDEQTGQKQVVLAKVFKTHPYQDLPEPLRLEAQDSITGLPLPERFDCLTLLGTAGVEPEWNSCSTSPHRKVIPLVDGARVEQLPLLKEFMEGLGWRPGESPCQDGVCDVFLLPDAVTHPSVSQRDSFVIPYGVKSIIGFGGVLDHNELFCVLLFSNITLDKRLADMLAPLGINAQLGARPLQGRVFRGQAARPDASPITPAQLSELLRMYEENIERQASVELSLAGALRVIPDSFFRFAPDGTILDYRDDGVLGERDHQQSFHGRRVQDILPANLAPRFLSAIAQASASKTVVPLVYPLVVDGSTQNFEARFSRLPAEHQVIAIIRNVTSQLDSENTLLMLARRAEAVSEMQNSPARESEEALTVRCLGIIERCLPARSASFRSVAAKSNKMELSKPDLEPADEEALSSQVVEETIEDLVRPTRKLTVHITENKSVAGILELIVDQPGPRNLIEDVRILAEELWRVVKQKRSSIELAKLAQALDQSPLSVVVTNTKAQIEYVNSAFVQLTGYQASEVIGKNPNVLNSGETPLETYREMWSAISSGKTWKGEFHNRRVDGTVYPEFAIVAPLKDPGGTITHYIAVKEDITEKKRLENELHEHRFELENLVQIRTADLAQKTMALELAARFDRCESHVLTILNERASLSKMLKGLLVILAEDLALTTSFIHLRNPQTGELSLFSSFEPKFELPIDLLEAVAAGQQPSYLPFDDELEEKYEWVGKIKGECTGLKMMPLIYQDDSMGFLTVAIWWTPEDQEKVLLQHLTDQVAVALQAQRQYEQMEALGARLNEREQRIALQNAALERANRLKSEFLANMSHELRTPLNAIIGFSEVMIDGLVGDLNPQQADYATEILSAGQYLLSLINDILDLSKIEAGKMELQYAPVDARPVCESALAIMSQLASQNKTELSLNFDDRIKSFWADERMFKQMLCNLLSNAVKFTKGGRVTLTASLREDPDAIVFAVEDTGIGIAKEDQLRLFKPFHQVDGSASRQYQGTGLGLALCKNLAELHSGYITLESELGVGSRFEIVLPYLENTAPDEEVDLARYDFKIDDADCDSTAPLAILVEDEDPAAALFSLYLNKANWRVIRARTPQEALQLFASTAPSLIILDLLLPDFDGLGLLEHLKADPKTSQIPVLVVSIIGQEHQQKAKALGAAEVLQKPVSQSTLLNFLATLNTQQTQSLSTKSGKS